MTPFDTNVLRCEFVLCDEAIAGQLHRRQARTLLACCKESSPRANSARREFVLGAAYP